MSLIRPEARLELSGELSLETTVEQRILAELQRLTTSVGKVEHNQQLMSVRLLGDVDGDTEHGRLPIVEAKVTNHDGRLSALESDNIRWRAYIAAAACFGGIVGSVLSLIGRLLVTAATKP
jgi:hypothetical protein